MPNILQVKFEENFSFVRQAIVNISWSPVDSDKLCHYRVTLIPLSDQGDKICSNRYSISAVVDKVNCKMTWRHSIMIDVANCLIIL